MTLSLGNLWLRLVGDPLPQLNRRLKKLAYFYNGQITVGAPTRRWNLHPPICQLSSTDVCSPTASTEYFYFIWPSPSSSNHVISSILAATPPATLHICPDAPPIAPSHPSTPLTPHYLKHASPPSSPPRCPSKPLAPSHPDPNPPAPDSLLRFRLRPNPLHRARRWKSLLP